MIEVLVFCSGYIICLVVGFFIGRLGQNAVSYGRGLEHGKDLGYMLGLTAAAKQKSEDTLAQENLICGN